MRTQSAWKTKIEFMTPFPQSYSHLFLLLSKGIAWDLNNPQTKKYWLSMGIKQQCCKCKGYKLKIINRGISNTKQKILSIENDMPLRMTCTFQIHMHSFSIWNVHIKLAQPGWWAWIAFIIQVGLPKRIIICERNPQNTMINSLWIHAFQTLESVANVPMKIQCMMLNTQPSSTTSSNRQLLQCNELRFTTMGFYIMVSTSASAQ